MLIAEDHSGWDGVTKPPAGGGLGFDASWYVEFYHNLIGDSDYSGGGARLLKQAGTGGSDPLAFDSFAGALLASQYDKVVYHESHDEAGNAGGTARTIVTAVNGAPLWGATRTAAEARSRVVFGMSLFSAGTPMFFMAEEVGAQRPYTVGNWFPNREDILGESTGNGRFMFRYYQDIITLSRRLRSVRTGNITVLHYSGANRIIVFKRWSRGEQVIVVASLNNTPFNSYIVQSDTLGIPDGGWKEIFNSDAGIYGGTGTGNGGAIIGAANGRLEVTMPANGLLVVVRQ
jgi:1,4-alpha-glucan branching enzyme